MKIIKKYSFEQYLTKDLIGFIKKENLMDFVEEEAKKQWEINNDNIIWNENSYPIPIDSVNSLFLSSISVLVLTISSSIFFIFSID